jgi:hypothetical protein
LTTATPTQSLLLEISPCLISKLLRFLENQTVRNDFTLSTPGLAEGIDGFASSSPVRALTSAPPAGAWTCRSFYRHRLDPADVILARQKKARTNKIGSGFFA